MTSIGVNRPAPLTRQSEKIAKCTFSQKGKHFHFGGWTFFFVEFFSARAYLDWNGINKPLKVRWYYNFDGFSSQARRNRNKQNYLGMLFEIINHFDRIICLCALILIIAAHEWMSWMFISFKPFQWYMRYKKQKYLQMYKCTKWAGLADSVQIHGH